MSASQPRLSGRGLPSWKSSLRREDQVKPDRRPEPLKPLSEALEDHSAEGIEILTAQPWRLAETTVVAMLALVAAALVGWFIGRTDVIVTAPGTLGPESEVRRIYAPVDGELADIYIAEGQPVQKDDVIGRINARGAIEAGTHARP